MAAGIVVGRAPPYHGTARIAVLGLAHTTAHTSAPSCWRWAWPGGRPSCARWRWVAWPSFSLVVGAGMWAAQRAFLGDDPGGPSLAVVIVLTVLVGAAVALAYLVGGVRGRP